MEELRDQIAAMQTLAQGGHVPEAAVACSRILERVESLLRELPGNAELDDLRAAMLTNLADLAEQRGEWGHAESAWRDAVPVLDGLAVRFPQLPRYRQLLGQAHYRLGELYLITYQPAKAEPHLRSAIQAWESSGADATSLARAAAKMGDVCRQLRRGDEAVTRLRHAQTLFEQLLRDGEDVADELIHVRRQLGLILREMRRPADAIAELEGAAALERRHPVDPDRRASLLTDLGAVYQSTGRPDGAEEAIRRALALVGDPRNDWFDRGRAVALINRLGVLYLDTGRLLRAEATFRLAVARGEGHSDRDLATPVHRTAAAFNLVRALRRLGRDADTGPVVTMLRDLEQTFPDEPSVESLRESIQPELSAPAPAAWPALKAAFLTWRLPGPPPLRRDHGAPPPDLAEPFRRARELVNERKYDDAIQTLAGLLVTNRSLPVQYDLIDLLRAAGREDAAIRALDLLLKEQPHYADGWFLRGLVLGRFLDDIGGPAEPLDFARHDAAIDAFDEAILLEPEEPEYRLWKGRALFRLAHALLARHQGLADACRKQSIDAPEGLASARAEAKCAVDRAEESFRRAAQLAPDDAEPPFALGALLAALEPDRIDDAKVSLRRALELRPDFAAAREELARLEAAV